MKTTAIALGALTCFLALTNQVSAQYSDTVEITSQVECNLPQITGTNTILTPCSSPNGFSDLQVGSIVFITYSSGSCATICMQGSNIDISAYYVVNNSAGLIQNKPKEVIKLFPQPTTGVFTVESPEIIELMEVYDAQGSLVLSKKGDLKNTIDITRFENGMYVLKVKTITGNSVHKIIKN